jgi:hypothetical protein
VIKRQRSVDCRVRPGTVLPPVRSLARLLASTPDKASCPHATSGPARKHHVRDIDILHAVRNSLRWVGVDDADRRADRWRTPGGGVLDIDSDDPVTIHAMPLRQKFYRFLAER